MNHSAALFYFCCLCAVWSEVNTVNIFNCHAFFLSYFGQMLCHFEKICMYLSFFLNVLILLVRSYLYIVKWTFWFFFHEVFGRRFLKYKWNISKSFLICSYNRILIILVQLFFSWTNISEISRQYIYIKIQNMTRGFIKISQSSEIICILLQILKGKWIFSYWNKWRGFKSLDYLVRGFVSRGMVL